MPTRRTIWRRRLTVLGGLLVVTGVAVAIFAGGSAEEAGNGSGKRDAGAAVETGEAGKLARRVLALGFEGTEPGAADPIAPNELGGVIVRGENWVDVTQGAALTASIAADGAPLVIAPQTGGPGRAFGDLPPAERQSEIGLFNDPQRAADWAATTASGLGQAGFNVMLGPAADVASISAPVAERSFSDSPDVAAALVAAAVRGCRATDIACAIGHFPGLGAASQNTDEGPATVTLDADGLAERDLVAFRAAVSERAPAIVVSHAFYAAFDPVTPASQSERIIGELLRRDLGFEGLVISDDLSTGAIRATMEVADAAVASLAAGIDLVQISDPADAKGVEEAIARAVERGELDLERLAEAAEQVERLQRRVTP